MTDRDKKRDSLLDDHISAAEFGPDLETRDARQTFRKKNQCDRSAKVLLPNRTNAGCGGTVCHKPLLREKFGRCHNSFVSVNLEMFHRGK